MNPSSPTPPFRLRHLAATTLLSLTLQTALAQTSTFDLPAQPLAQALAQFARQAGLQLAASPDLLQGLQGRAVNGTLEVKTALDELLRGTGLHGHISDGVLTIGRRPLRSDRAATLPTVNVKGSAEESATGPVSGYVARRSISGTKTDTPLLETPQSISVVGQEEISSRGAQDMSRALAYSPGVVSENFGPAGLLTDYVLVRGFTAPVFLDGTRLPGLSGNTVGWATETWGLERIEALKGPASMLYGQGAPGGLLNLASKRPIGPTSPTSPTAAPYHAAQFTVGSFNRRQAGVDLSGPLASEGQFAYRLVALVRKSDDQFDFNKHERQYIAPSLAWTLSPDTRLTFLTSYLRDNNSGNRGPLPLEGTLLPNPNGPLPRNRTVSEPTEQLQRRQYAVGYELEHRFNDQWRFQQKLRHTDVQLKKNDFSYVTGWLRDLNGIPLDYRTVHREMTSLPSQHRVFTLDNSIQADFNTASIKHKALVGIDLQRIRQSHQLGLTTLPDIDLYAPVYGAPHSPPDLQWAEGTRSDQVGLYLQDQMKIERLLLTMSGRYDHVKSTAVSGDLSAPTLNTQTDHKATGRLGINYLLANGFSPYASYSTSFEPALGVDFKGQSFKPTSGEQFEAGLKYQPDHGHISATASVFRLTQKNLLTIDPAHFVFQTQTGEVQVDGLELETKANFGSGLGLTMAAAWLNPKITANNDGTTGNRIELTPKVQASAWLSYRLPVGLTLGLGARHVGSIYGDSINSALAPAYTLIDTSVQYELAHLSTSLVGAKLGLSVNNLADKTYLSACGWDNCSYGAERSANLTLNYEW